MIKLAYIKFYWTILVVSSLFIVSACGDTTDKYPFILRFEAEDNLGIYNIGHNSYEISAEGGILRINGSIDFTVDVTALDNYKINVDKGGDLIIPETMALTTVDNKNIQIIFSPNNSDKLRKFEIDFNPEWGDDVKFTFWQFNNEL